MKGALAELGPGRLPRERLPAILFALVPMLEASSGLVGEADTLAALARAEELALCGRGWGAPCHPKDTSVELTAQMAVTALGLARNPTRNWSTRSAALD